MHPFKLRYKDPSFPILFASVSDKGNIVQAHYHEAPELILVRSGNLDMTISGKEYHCAEHDLLFIPSGALHFGFTQEGATLNAISFDLSLVVREDLSLPIESMFRSTVDINHMLSRGSFSYQALLQAFTDLRFLCLNKPVEQWNRFHILAQLYGICGVFSQGLPTENSSEQNQARLLPVLEYIEQNYHSNIRLQDLSHILHICDNHLIRLFKSVTGTTPAQYILEYRIKQAMQLLAETDLSVAEISEAVGFSTPNFMAKAFAGSIHMSPRTYRKLHHGN